MTRYKKGAPFKLKGSPFKQTTTESAGQAVTDQNELVNVNRITETKKAKPAKNKVTVTDNQSYFNSFNNPKDIAGGFNPDWDPDGEEFKTWAQNKSMSVGNEAIPGSQTISYQMQHIPSNNPGTKGDMVDGFHVGDVRSQMVRGRRISNYDNKFNRKINNTENKLNRLSGENKNEKLQGKLNKMLDGYTPDQIANMGKETITDESGNEIANPDYDAGRFAAYNKKMQSNRYQRISSNLAENQRMQSLNTDKSKRQKNLENKLSNLKLQQENNKVTQGFHTDGVNQGRNINLYSQDEMKGLIEAGGKAKGATAGSSSDRTIVTNPGDYVSLSDLTGDAGTTSLGSGGDGAGGDGGNGGDGAGGTDQNNNQNNDQNNNQNDQDNVNNQNQGGGSNDERGENEKEVDSTSVANNIQPNKFFIPTPMGNNPNKANKQTAFENLLANMSDSGLDGAPELDGTPYMPKEKSTNKFGGPKMKFERSGTPFKQRNKHK